MGELRTVAEIVQRNRCFKADLNVLSVGVSLSDVLQDTCDFSAASKL